MNYKNELNKLENLKLTDLKPYTLVNNYGFSFKIANEIYYVQHVLNVYGVDANFWALSSKNRVEEFDTFEELIETLKELKQNEL